jgi:hypothetical protein
VEFEGTPKKALLKECLWKMGKSPESQEGENDEASQHSAQRQTMFSIAPPYGKVYSKC